LEQALGTALQAERSRNFKPTLPGGLTVGLSSGTTGRRGVFLVSPRERQRWAGAMLARLLSGASVARLLNPLAPPLRVAFLLRANSNLYTTVQSRRLRFVFCDLLQPWGEQLQQLNALQPDLLIAPASVLQVLARAQQQAALRIRPSQVISVAEVLEPDDAALIRQVWHVPAAQVYQCTEGFLGYTCEAGHLHLNEEWLHIETAWLDAERTRFQPIVTDFSRSAQAFVRYRLDDVLHLAPGPCDCGRVSRRLVSIEGRSDDLLWLQDNDPRATAAGVCGRAAPGNGAGPG
jgi:putative adenylate-forming enzyme